MTTEHHIDSTRTAVVSSDIKWMPIDENTPYGVKIQLISDKYGIAQYGHLQRSNTYYTHWFPMPTFRKKTA